MQKENTEFFSWVDSRLRVGESEVEGRALFANVNIPAGEFLVVQGGKILSLEQLDKLDDVEYTYTAFQISKNFYICPAVIAGTLVIDGIFLVNHSCAPNAGFLDSITLVSMREIQKDEEVCFDYAMCDMEIEGEVPWEDMKCNCGAQECRNSITGSDWKIKDLQKKYEGYFSPYIQKYLESLRHG